MLRTWKSKVGFECLDKLTLQETAIRPRMKVRIIARLVGRPFTTEGKPGSLYHGGCVDKLLPFQRPCCIRIILTVGINWFVDWGKSPKPCLSAPSCKFSHPSTNHRVGSSKVYRVYPETWGRVSSALKYTNRWNQLVWLNWLTKLKYIVSYILFCCAVDKFRSQQLWNEVLVLTRWCSPCSARPSWEARFAQTATRRRNSSTIKRPVRTPEVKLAGNAQTAANHLHGRSPFFLQTLTQI